MEHCKCLEQRNRQRKIQALFEQAGIPKRFASKSFDNYEPKNPLLERALQMARKYVEKFETLKEDGRNGLYLVGPTGTGKTHLSYAIINGVIEKYQTPVVAGTVPDLLEMFRPKQKKNEQAEERLELAKTVDLLLLDDLGAEKDSEWVAERLFLIINARYLNQLPTIITSNVPLDALETDPYGKPIIGWERITSRIREMCHRLLMDGEDFRREG